MVDLDDPGNRFAMTTSVSDVTMVTSASQDSLDSLSGSDRNSLDDLDRKPLAQAEDYDSS